MTRINNLLLAILLAALMVSFSNAQPPNGLPDNARADLDGTLEVFIRENLESGDSQHEFFLNQGPDAPPIELLFVDGPPKNLRSGVGVSVRGTMGNGTFSVEAVNLKASSSNSDSQVSSDESAGTAPAVTLDTRSVLVVVVNASDVAHTSTDLANMEGYYFGAENSMKDMYDKISFGQLVIEDDVDGNGSPDVFGPINSARSGADICANPFAYANEFLSAAEAQFGVDAGLYRHRVFALPRNLGCGWTGYANVGCGTSCTAFNVWSQDLNTISHEMAHNLGMGHVGEEGGAEYSDYSSFMGYSLSNGVRGLDAVHHWQMGWYESFDPTSTLTVTASGSYEIASLQETQDLSDGPSLLAPSILRINVSNGDPYFLSARQAAGYDADLSFLNSAALNGVNIHRHPGTGWEPSWRTAQLDAGQSYSDASNNLTITQVDAKSADQVVTLNIDLGDGECVEAAPSLSLNPTFATVGPNTDYTYTVTLTNNDSAICDGSIFDLVLDVETTPFASLNVAAGSQGSTGLTIVGASTSGDIEFTVSTVAEPGATVSGILTVDATAPDEVTNLSGSYTRKGKNHRVKLDWVDSVSSDVDSYEILRDGVSITTTSQNSYTDTLSGSIVATYNYTVKAVDGVGNVSSGITVVVETTGDDGGGGGGGNGNGGGNGGGKPKK